MFCKSSLVVFLVCSLAQGARITGEHHVTGIVRFTATVSEVLSFEAMATQEKERTVVVAARCGTGPVRADMVTVSHNLLYHCSRDGVEDNLQLVIVAPESATMIASNFGF